MLSFCDLAGSERISKTKNVGERQTTSTTFFWVVEGGRQHQQLSPGLWMEADNINNFLLVVGRGRQHQLLSPGWWQEAGHINSSLLVVSGVRHNQQLSPGWWVEAGNINSSLLMNGRRKATSTAISWVVAGDQATSTAFSWCRA
jgi:hypothetical protein